MSYERALNEGVLFICQVMETDSDHFSLVACCPKLRSCTLARVLLGGCTLVII